jgi:hypothetical protein
VGKIVKTYNENARPCRYPCTNAFRYIDGMVDGPNKYVEWPVTDNVTLTNDPPIHYQSALALAKEPLCSSSAIQDPGLIIVHRARRPVEIVSPVMHFCQGGNLRVLVEELWSTVTAFYVIQKVKASIRLKLFVPDVTGKRQCLGISRSCPQQEVEEA